MVLYATVVETPGRAMPYVAIIRDEVGVVLVTLPASTRRLAEERLDAAKFRLVREAVVNRVLKHAAEVSKSPARSRRRVNWD